MKNKIRLLAAPYALWAVSFIIIPLLMIFYYGCTDRSGSFTLSNIASIATHEHSKALWLSIKLSLIATALCLLLGYPLAAVLARIKSRTGII
ncbi:MAG: ABC transporter permease, partial [Lachnospiraceae bacterium]|nr:ABC transporter permease [Lachnospiraceae bacterium]